MQHLYALIFFVAWLGGIVLAKGFWICLASIFFPPFACLLFVERLMHLIGMI